MLEKNKDSNNYNFPRKEEGINMEKEQDYFAKYISEDAKERIDDIIESNKKAFDCVEKLFNQVFPETVKKKVRNTTNSNNLKQNNTKKEIAVLG